MYNVDGKRNKKKFEIGIRGQGEKISVLMLSNIIITDDIVFLAESEVDFGKELNGKKRRKIVKRMDKMYG